MLAQREHVTAVSLQELKTATDLLAQREKDMQSVVLDLENKLHQLQEEDHLLVQKRLEIAVAHRELLNTRAERILRARADTSPSAVIKNKEAFSRLHMSNYTNFSTNASSSTPAYYSQQQMQGGHSSGVSGNIFPYSETEATTYVSDWRERFEDRLSQAGGAFIMNVYESGPGSSEYELQCARQLLYQNQAY